MAVDCVDVITRFPPSDAANISDLVRTCLVGGTDKFISLSGFLYVTSKFVA